MLPASYLSLYNRTYPTILTPNMSTSEQAPKSSDGLTLSVVQDVLCVTELLENILLQLSQCDVRRCARVCKRFSHAINGSPALRRTLFLAPNNKHDRASLANAAGSTEATGELPTIINDDLFRAMFWAEHGSGAILKTESRWWILSDFGWTWSEGALVIHLQELYRDHNPLLRERGPLVFYDRTCSHKPSFWRTYFAQPPSHTVLCILILDGTEHRRDMYGYNTVEDVVMQGEKVAQEEDERPSWLYSANRRGGAGGTLG